MSENYIKNEMSISDKTPVRLPLHVQIGLWILIIGITITSYTFINTFAKADEQQVRDIKVLQDTKLDKSVYEHRHLLDSLENTATQRKLNLIMHKLKIEQY